MTEPEEQPEYTLAELDKAMDNFFAYNDFTTTYPEPDFMPAVMPEDDEE